MKKVLIIDDDKFIRRVLSKALVDHYEVDQAGSGEEGLQMATVNKPDIILLDVQMPGLNGYEVCDQFRQVDATRFTPVIFLSSRSSVRERMLGYESGGDDYLVKPCDPEELRAKINVLLTHRETKLDLKTQAIDAQNTALLAMAGSSELGMALSFAEKSFAVRSFEELANCFFMVTNNLGLNCCLNFSTNWTEMYFSSKGEVAPLEQQLMQMLKQQGRIIDFGARTQINYPKASLLIKNMPLENMEKYGRFKDLFPFMLEATEAKIMKMEGEHAILEQTQNIFKSFAIVEDALVKLSEKLFGSRQGSATILQSLREELEQTIPKMGLDDDQEDYLVNKVDSSLLKAVEIGDNDSDIRETFDNVKQQLKQLMNQQRKVIENIVIRPNKQPEPASEEAQEPSVSDGGSGSVELF